MIERGRDGKLRVDALDAEIFFGDLFEKCESVREVDWVKEQLMGVIEVASEERVYELEEGQGF